MGRRRRSAVAGGRSDVLSLSLVFGFGFGFGFGLRFGFGSGSGFKFRFGSGKGFHFAPAQVVQLSGVRVLVLGRLGAQPAVA